MIQNWDASLNSGNSHKDPLCFPTSSVWPTDPSSPLPTLAATMPTPLKGEAAQFVATLYPQKKTCSTKNWCPTEKKCLPEDLFEGSILNTFGDGKGLIPHESQPFRGFAGAIVTYH